MKIVDTLEPVLRWGGWRYAGWGTAAFLLLLPAVAMRFTDEVHWTGADFVFAAVLMLAVGVPFELVVRATQSLACRAGAALALGAMFLLVWVNGAVGIIGSENNPANAMYAGVLAVALFGAGFARLRPRGLALAMGAAAAAQVAVGAIALAGNMGAADPSWPFDVVGATLGFAAIWGASAWLFGVAARE